MSSKVRSKQLCLPRDTYHWPSRIRPRGRLMWHRFYIHRSSDPNPSFIGAEAVGLELRDIYIQNRGTPSLRGRLTPNRPASNQTSRSQYQRLWAAICEPYIKAIFEPCSQWGQLSCSSLERHPPHRFAYVLYCARRASGHPALLRTFYIPQLLDGPGVS